MKLKNAFKYILDFLIHYVTTTVVLWILEYDKSIGFLLIDGLIITCVFMFIELISLLIRKRTDKKNSHKEVSFESKNKDDEAIATWIVGISFVILIILRVVI